MLYLKYPPRRNDHFLGNLNAPVVIVEYGDYECSQCARAYSWKNIILSEFKEEICLVYRHFPLFLIHPHSLLASVAAESAGSRNRFWEMHKLLFENYNHLSLELILELGRTLKLENGFISHGKKIKEKIISRLIYDVKSGEECGVKTTPTFFMNGVLIEGLNGPEKMRENILNLLRGHMISA